MTDKEKLRLIEKICFTATEYCAGDEVAGYNRLTMAIDAITEIIMFQEDADEQMDSKT